MENPMTFLGYFQIAICAYILYCGITKKGQVYKDETIHPTQREYFKKKITFFCLVFAPIGLLGGICDLQMWSTLGWICYGIFFAGLIWLLVVTFPIGIDRYAKKLDQEKKAAKPGNQVVASKAKAKKKN